MVAASPASRSAPITAPSSAPVQMEPLSSGGSLTPLPLNMTPGSMRTYESCVIYADLHTHTLES